ncbi:MAG TPA: hypothetical protein PKL13_04190, partial [bacterium]|nr:hypothetical protein [bacterium]
GVKTDEGKEISKMNALKHGLLSSKVLLDDEEENELTELEDNIKNQLLPIGEFELFLTDRIISNIWRLGRVLKIESAAMMLEKNSKEIIFEDVDIKIKRTRDMLNSDLLDRVLRYETSIERGIYKSLHELQRIQAIRAGKQVSMPIAIDIDLNKKEE